MHMHTPFLKLKQFGYNVIHEADHMISLHARKHVSCEYCMETISHAVRDVE